MSMISLGEDEAIILTQQEAIIERGLQTFYEVGIALLTIRDQRLYRQAHASFEDYCHERWGLSRPRAYQLIEAAAVRANVSTIVDILPANEAQARPLTSLPPQRQAEVWQEAVETAPEGKITAAHVARTVERMTAPPPITATELLTPVAPVPTISPRPTMHSVPASPRTEDADDMSVREYAILTNYTHMVEDLLKVAHKHRETLTEIDPRDIAPLTTEADESREASVGIIFNWFARKVEARRQPLRRVK